MQSLSIYIQHPELIDAQVVEELWQLVDRYPTFQAVRMLLVRGLYQLQDERFGEALRQAALFLPDRTQLFEQIEGDKFRLDSHITKPLPQQVEETSADRTQALIDSFLSDRPEANRQHRPRTVDASVDYMSYLEQLEDAPVAEQPKDDPEASSEKTDSGQSKIVASPVRAEEPAQDTAYSIGEDVDEEWEETRGEEVPSISQERTEEEQEVLGNAPSEDYFTETLARIYIKQCKYDKAIEIIRRLSLNYPKKSRYFADQIRFLGKLILNEQCKNEEK